MPGPAPKTDKWRARENLQDDEHVLRVSGLVEVPSTNKTAHLKEAGGGAPKVLVLELGIGTDDTKPVQARVWKPAIFQKDTKADHYDTVTIRYDGKDVAQCRVVNDDEHDDHLAKVTKVANVQQAGKKGPAAKKRAAAPKKRAAGPKKQAAVPKKRAASPKKRPAATKKSRPAASKKKTASAKRRPAAAKKRVASAKKRASAPARRRAPASAKKRRTGRRR